MLRPHSIRSYPGDHHPNHGHQLHHRDCKNLPPFSHSQGSSLLTCTPQETLPTPSVTVHKPTTVYTEVCATETATVGVRCGLKGCGKVLSIIEANVGKYKTAAACKARCLQVPNCASFQFGGLIPHLTVCNLAKVDANKFHSDASQLFPVCKDNKIYDRNCPL